MGINSILQCDLLHADIKIFNKNVISSAASEQACKIYKVSFNVHSIRRYNYHVTTRIS